MLSWRESPNFADIPASDWLTWRSCNACNRQKVTQCIPLGSPWDPTVAIQSDNKIAAGQRGWIT